MKDFFDDFSGIVHVPGGAVEYENGVLVERKEKRRKDHQSHLKYVHRNTAKKSKTVVLCEFSRL